MQLHRSKWTPSKSWRQITPGSATPLRKEVFHQRIVTILSDPLIPYSAETTLAYCQHRNIDGHARFHLLLPTQLPRAAANEKLADEQEADDFNFDAQKGKRRLGAFHTDDYHTMWTKLIEYVQLDCALEDTTTMVAIFSELKQYEELRASSNLALTSAPTQTRSTAIKTSALTEINLKNIREFEDIELWQDHVETTFALYHVKDYLKNEATCRHDLTVSQSLYTTVSQALEGSTCHFLVETHKASALVSALYKAIDTEQNTPAHKDNRMLEEVKKLLNVRLDTHTSGPEFVHQWKNSINYFKKHNIKIIEDKRVARAILLNGIEDESYMQCKSFIAKNRDKDIDEYFAEIMTASELLRSTPTITNMPVRRTTVQDGGGKKQRSKTNAPVDRTDPNYWRVPSLPKGCEKGMTPECHAILERWRSIANNPKKNNSEMNKLSYKGPAVKERDSYPPQPHTRHGYAGSGGQYQNSQATIDAGYAYYDDAYGETQYQGYPQYKKQVSFTQQHQEYPYRSQQGRGRGGPGRAHQGGRGRGRTGRIKGHYDSGHLRQYRRTPKGPEIYQQEEPYDTHQQEFMDEDYEDEHYDQHPCEQQQPSGKRPARVLKPGAQTTSVSRRTKRRAMEESPDEEEQPTHDDEGHAMPSEPPAKAAGRGRGPGK